MKRSDLLKFCVSLLFATSATVATAEQRSLDDALSLATQQIGKVELAQTTMNAPALRDYSTSADAFVPYYIFNKSEGDGFVIISGSSLMRPVIAYGDNALSLDTELPDNIQYWFDMISAAATFLESHPQYALTTEQQVASSEVIEPLLGGIIWDQGKPFNNLCPSVSGERCPVGCVATAAAQCMYYWKYPTQGIGSNSYKSDAGGTLSVDFSKQTYNYSLMYDAYTSSATTQQNAEVAKLSYHAGVAFDMQYAPSGSGTTIYNMHKGLINHFGYDDLTAVMSREYFTFDEWQSAIMNELRNKRPVLFCGVDESDGGHCFVVDGINADGLYHVNWGWGGYLNNYFDISVLNSNGAGTGARVNEDGFAYYQQILVNTAPSGKVTHGKYYTSIMGYYSNEMFTVADKTIALGQRNYITSPAIVNLSYLDVEGSLGLAFTQDGIVKAFSVFQDYNEYGKLENYTFTGTDGFPGMTLEGQLSGLYLDSTLVLIPRSLADGTYKVYIALQDLSAQHRDSIGLVRFPGSLPNYLNCVVANGKATFTELEGGPKLAVSNWSLSSDEIKVNDSKAVSCTLTNQDAENSFVGRYYLKLTAPNGSATWAEGGVVTLAPNASTTLTFGKKPFMSSGTWNAQVYVYRQNVDDDPTKDRMLIEGSDVSFDVTGDATSNAIFKLSAAPELVANSAYGDSLFIDYPAKFLVGINNTGEAYSGTLQIQFFQSTSLLATIPIGTITCNFEMEGNSSKEFIVSGDVVRTTSAFKGSATGTTYLAKLFYERNGYYTQMSAESGVTNSTKVKLYNGSPTTGIAEITCDTNDSNIVYNLQGQRVSDPSAPGFYIVNGKKCIIK
ncbi:MAG: C10 family peptidase [Bacteroidales bacterium]|nr:C10 family peptidase [Bacteroidales bacterium]